MLNNKYLAAVLAVVAVVVVVYQVFFNKPSRPKPQPAAPAVRPSQLAVSPAVNRGTARTPQTRHTQRPAQGTSPQTDAELVIDFASPILLKRVYENPMEKSTRREVPGLFGRAIFSPPPGREYETPTGTEDAAPLQFRLNSIIIDKHRRIAVINDTILFTGETIAGARVESIQKNRVILKLRDRNIVLSTGPGLTTVKPAGGKSDG